MKYFDVLEKTARDLAPVAAARIAACIVIKNSIISFGTNQLKSHPFQLRFGRNNESIYLHAETSAIKNAMTYLSDVEDLRKSTMYICRVKHDNENRHHMCWGLSRPCAGCMRAIATFGIRNVYYSLNGTGNYSSLNYT